MRPFGADGLGTVILRGSVPGVTGAVAALSFWFVAVRWTAGPDRRRIHIDAVNEERRLYP